MARRIRTDSVKTQTEMAAAKLPECPKHVRLRAKDRPFFDSIVKSKEYSTWHTADLETAAVLARTRADIERIQRQLDKDGDTIVNHNGVEVLNPLHGLLETLTKRSVTLAKSLQVDTVSTVDMPYPTRRKRATLQREMAEAVTVSSDDSLLARPTH